MEIGQERWGRKSPLLLKERARERFISKSFQCSVKSWTREKFVSGVAPDTTGYQKNYEELNFRGYILQSKTFTIP